jgi:putative toxin-antitoxin system antitoxin component (TIGR02293 family)
MITKNRVTRATRPIVPRPPVKRANPSSFTELLGQLGDNRSEAVAAIRIGFPASLLKDTGLYFDVPVQRIRTIVRLPETTAHTLVKRGALMDAAASERIWRLADLMHMASKVFGNDEAAKTWLRTPNLTFQDGAPMDYLDTEPGAIAVRQVLNAIATGGVL